MRVALRRRANRRAEHRAPRAPGPNVANAGPSLKDGMTGSGIAIRPTSCRIAAISMSRVCCASNPLASARRTAQRCDVARMVVVPGISGVRCGGKRSRNADEGLLLVEAKPLLRAQCVDDARRHRRRLGPCRGTWPRPERQSAIRSSSSLDSSHPSQATKPIDADSTTPGLGSTPATASSSPVAKSAALRRPDADTNDRELVPREPEHTRATAGPPTEAPRRPPAACRRPRHDQAAR